MTGTWFRISSMDYATQRRTSAAITSVGLVLAVVVAIPSAIVGFAMGMTTARAGNASVHTVVQQRDVAGPPPVAPVIRMPRMPAVAPITNGDPDWLEDPDAMASIPARLAAATSFAGRYQAIVVNDQYLTTLVEVEGQGVDSVVFSWGNVIVNPLPQTPAEMKTLDQRLFSVSERQLRAIPALVDQVIDDHPAGTEVETLTMINVIEPPRILIQLRHPRIEFEQVVLDLEGRPKPY